MVTEERVMRFSLTRSDDLSRPAGPSRPET